MKKFKWEFKGIGETYTLFGGKIFVKVWQCLLTGKIKTSKI